MESTEKKHLGSCQDTEQSPNLTNINRFPDEVLLEIFDSYRQSTDNYNHCWRKNYAWFNLAHVCRKWRAVVLASSSRLDLNVVVGPVKPGNFKTILSGHLPILIDYTHSYDPRENNGSAVWRLCAALRHRDRVREISFRGCADTFRKFIDATNYHFPALESLVLYLSHGHEPEIPATFLRGLNRSDLPLRRLELHARGPYAFFVSGLLSSATALTELTLSFSFPYHRDFDSLQGSSFLAYLQAMKRLRSLHLTTPYDFPDFLAKSQHSPVPEDTIAIVPMSELTSFYYYGRTTSLNHLMFGLSAPSLQNVRFVLCPKNPLTCLSRVIDEVREEFRSVSVAFDLENFHLLSSTHSGETDHFKPRPSFRLDVNCSPSLTNSMSSTPSTKLSMAEELTLNFLDSNMTRWDHSFSICDFLRQFRSVRVLRVNPFVREIGLYLKQDEDGQGTILPVLEEIEISIPRLKRHNLDGEYQRRAADALAALKPCKRAGRAVKCYHCEQTETQSRNAGSW